MVTCKEATDISVHERAADLPAWPRFRYWLHVKVTCPNCKRFLRQLRAAVALLGKLPRPVASDEVVQSVLARLA